MPYLMESQKTWSSDQSLKKKTFCWSSKGWLANVITKKKQQQQKTKLVWRGWLVHLF